MKVLVTGGAGFIGSHLVDKLRAAGHEPRIFDVRPSPYPEHAGIDMVLGDLLDGPSVLAAAEGCDVIAHLAASADVGIVARDPREAEALNAGGTFNVLEAARATGARVLYASTIWAYSDVVADAVDEDTALALPSHFYTATKVAGEMYCRSYGELYGVESTILRFGIPYGPRARPAAVLPIFVNKALAGEPLTIAGDGSQSRRFVYVEDLADGVIAALAPVAAGRVYNLVGDEDTTVRQIADAVGAAVGSVEIVHTEGRSGDFAGAQVSGARAAAELGWRASTSFADGVRLYVAWVRSEQETPRAAPAPGPAAGIRAPMGARPLPTTAPTGSATLASPTPEPAVPGTVPARWRPVAVPNPVRLLAALALGVLAVIGYLQVLEALGLDGRDAATTALVTVVAAACGLGATQMAPWAAWSAGLVVLLPLTLTRVDEALHLGRVDLSTVVLGAAGAGLLLAIIGSAPARGDRARLAERAA